MARFPRTETDLAVLVEQMLAGFETHRKDFPNADLKGMREAWARYRETKRMQAEAFEAYRAATIPKDEALDALIAKTKAELKQAEVDTGDDPARLRKIGWGGASTSEELALPGPPLNARIAAGRPKVRLEWDPPGRGVGGKVQVYEVERRTLDPEKGPGEWAIAHVALEPGADLPDQPYGIQEYRIVARNRRGASPPSTSVFLA